MLHLPVGCRWQPGEDVPQVGEGVDAAATAVFDDGVEDGAAFTRSGVADEEPILFANGGGTDRVLDAVVVDFEPTVLRQHVLKNPQIPLAS